MTTELTLRENALGLLKDFTYGNDNVLALAVICTALDATGAPAYIRVADDLRGVVREGE